MTKFKSLAILLVVSFLGFCAMGDTCSKVASNPSKVKSPCGPSCKCGCVETGVCTCTSSKPPCTSCSCGCEETGVCSCSYKKHYGQVSHRKLMTESAVKVNMTVSFPVGGASIYCGSGVVVASTEDSFDLLTCAHVINHRADFRRGKLVITTHDSNTYPAIAWAWGGDRDLALLKVSKKGCGSSVRVVSIPDSESYKQGTSISKAGFTSGGPLRITSGECLGEEVDHDGYKHQLLRIDSAGGDSGCGVYRDSDSSLVGILTGSSNSPNRGHAVHIRPLPVIKKFLAASRRRPSATFSVPLTETPVNVPQTWTRTLPDGSTVVWTWTPRGFVPVAPRKLQQAPRLPKALPSYIPPQAPSRLYFARPLYRPVPMFRSMPLRSGGC